MDKKEMLYEISLKYNTLKMYDNTLEQMKKNGINSKKAIEEIKRERDSIEKEFEILLDSKTEEVNKNGYRTNPKIEEENQFLKKANEELNRPKKYYYDDQDEYIPEHGLDEFPYDYDYDEDYSDEMDEEENKPRLADVQDKISNSTWISSSNFIFRFPKDEINIDEWRVSSFSYCLNQPYKTCSCNGYDDDDESKEIKHSGNLYVSVNDFSEKIDDYQYNILTNIVLSLFDNNVIEKDLYADIIDNGGNVLYTLVFEKCRFVGTNGVANTFDYKNTSLSQMHLSFSFKNLIVLAPNEDLKKE